MFPNNNKSPTPQKRNRGQSAEDEEESENLFSLHRSPRDERSGFPASASTAATAAVSASLPLTHADPSLGINIISPSTHERSSRYATPVSPRNEEEEATEIKNGGGGSPPSQQQHDRRASPPRDRLSDQSAAFTNSSTRTSRSRASSHSVRPTPPPPLPVSAPARSSSSSSFSDEEDGDETNEKDPRNYAEDVAKKYPMFTEAYAEKFRRDATPFLRVVETSGQPPVRSMDASTLSSAGGGGVPSSSPGSPNAISQHRERRFVLYDTYLYEKTLGKGTFSKVVLGTASPASAVISNQISGDVPPRVALKVFRDKEEYIEACWDEFTILNSICVDPPSVTAEAMTASMAASGHRHGAASYPSPYISIRSVVMFTASTCGIKQQYFADQGRFIIPLGYVAHPVHPAIVFPVMGPTLLNVLNTIRQKSKEVTRISRHKRQRAEGGCDAASERASPATVTGPVRDFASRVAASVDPMTTQSQQQPTTTAAAAPASPTGQRRVYYRGLPLPLLKAVLYQMLTFLHFIHCRGVVHTDLKPENVLFESSKFLSVDVGIYYTHYARKDGDVPASKETMKRTNDGFKLQSSSMEQRVRRDEQTAFTPPTQDLVNERTVTPLQQDGKPLCIVLNMTGGTAATAADNSNEDTAANTVPMDALPAGQDDITLAHHVRIAMPVMNSIRVMDLGAAQFLSTFRDYSLIPGYAHFPVSYNPIQTSHYRSPEVLLGFGWSTSADIFSLGCMIPELLTGECLFMPNHTMEHLAMMQHIIGKFHDKEGIRRGTTANLRSVFACNMRTFRHYFSLQPNNRDYDLKWPVTKATVQEQARQQRFASNPGGKGEEDGLDALEETLPEDVEYVTRKPTLEEILSPLPDLLDLTRRMLHYHPFKRITAEEALEHPFFGNM